MLTVTYCGHITDDAAQFCLSNLSSILVYSWIIKCFNYFTRGSKSLQIQREQSTVFWQRTMAADLEILPLIMTASHFAANCPSACWRLRSDEQNHIICKEQSKPEQLISSSIIKSPKSLFPITKDPCRTSWASFCNDPSKNGTIKHWVPLLWHNCKNNFVKWYKTFQMTGFFHGWK